MNSESLLHLTDRLLEACDGDYDLAIKFLYEAAQRREKFRQEVVMCARQLFAGQVAPAPKVAGAVSTAIHAPYNKVLSIVQKEFSIVRGSGVHVA